MFGRFDLEGNQSSTDGYFAGYLLYPKSSDPESYDPSATPHAEWRPF